MANRPRTAEDFDSWFNKVGDPWAYKEKTVLNRLRKTIKFLLNHLGSDFKGGFLEIGAYDGSFTTQLGGAFPNATVVVNDISAVALQQAQKAVVLCPGLRKRTQFILKDSLHISKNDFGNNVLNNISVILLLECLYYLKEHEQDQALLNLVTLLPNASIAVSGPITGSPYFTEERLLEMFQRVGRYKLFAIEVLNLRNHRYTYLPGIYYITNHLRFLRRRVGNQVLFYFQPQKTDLN